MDGPMVQFRLGPEGKPMIIHKVLVEELSQPLKTLLNGPMEEAQSGVVKWKDVDKSTFVLFAEFAYAGDYTLGSESLAKDLRGLAESPSDGSKETRPDEMTFQPVNTEEEPKGPSDIDQAFEQSYDGWCGTTFTSKKKKGARKWAKEELDGPTVTKGKFSNLNFPFPPNLIQRHKTRPNASPTEDYGPVLLGHARLYVLADKYDIPTLKDLSLHRLYETLRTFTLYEDRYDDVLGLVRYVYDNTSGCDDRLRDLVLRYLASEAKPFMKNEKCRDLVEERGELGRDLLSVILE